MSRGLALSGLMLVSAVVGAQGGTNCNDDFYGTSSADFIGVCTGEKHSCAWTSGGSAFCWGEGGRGRLGYGDQTDRGKNNNQMGDKLPTIDIWGASSDVGVTSLSCGKAHTCAALADGTVRCWGENNKGQLGYGDDDSRGDGNNEMGDSLPAVDLSQGSEIVEQVALGSQFSCVLLSDGSVYCWGENADGQLGRGNDNDVGRNNEPTMSNLAPISLGTGVTGSQICAGEKHACVLATDGSVKCWGKNDKGQLGLGDNDNRGEDSNQMGDDLPFVSLGNGRTATGIACGEKHVCAVLDDGSVKCWGENSDGQLGYGDTEKRGDDGSEMGDALPAVDLASSLPAVTDVTAGVDWSCAIFRSTHGIVCWGDGSSPVLGQEDSSFSSAIRDIPEIDLGSNFDLTAAEGTSEHICAVSEQGTVKCWGKGNDGRLGYEDTTTRGDDSNTMGDDLPTVDVGGTLEECVACPDNSNAPAGSTAETACTCNTGYSGTAGGPCTAGADPTTSHAATTSSSTTTVAPTSSSSTTTQEPTTSSSTTTLAPTSSSSSTTLAPTTSSSTTTTPAPTTSSSTTTTLAPTTSSSTTTQEPTTSSSTTTLAPTTSSSTTTQEPTTSSTSTTPAPTTSSSTTTSVAPTTSSSSTTEEPTTSSTTTTVAPTTSSSTTTPAPSSSSTTTGAPTTSSSTTTTTPAPATSSSTVAPTTSSSSTTTQEPTTSKTTPAPTTSSSTTTTVAPTTSSSTTPAPTTSSSATSAAPTTASSTTSTVAPTTSSSTTSLDPTTSASTSTTPAPTTTSSTTTTVAPTTLDPSTCCQCDKGSCPQGNCDAPGSSSRTECDAVDCIALCTPTTTTAPATSSSTTTLAPTSSTTTTVAPTSSSTTTTPAPTSTSSTTVPLTTSSSSSTTAEPTTSSSTTTAQPTTSSSTTDMPGPTTSSTTDTLGPPTSSTPAPTTSSSTPAPTTPSTTSTTLAPTTPLIVGAYLTININLPNLSPGDVTAAMESALITIFADLLSVGSSRINIATSRRRLLAASVTVRVVASSPAEATTLAAVLSDMDLAAHIALHLSWQTITVSNIQIAVEDLATTTTPQPTLAPETSAPTTAPPSTPPPPSAIPVVAAVPSKCEIGGGTVVTLILGASPPAFAAPPAVVFSSDAQEVTSSVVSPSTLVAKCPAASQSAGLGEIVVAGGGSVLARFEFVYVLPAPSVSPAQVLASGGSVDISIFGSPPPAIPADCNVTFGGVAGSIVSSSAAGSQLVVKTIAPPALTAGRVALALTCVDVSGLRLTYLAVPEATAVVTVPSAGECLTWGECTVAVAMTDAPSTATEASELLLACSGVDFDVFPGSTSRDPRLAVLQATPDLLSATVAFPPPQTAGTITCQLAPLTAPAGINPADMAASFSIQVSLPPAAINSVRPSSVPLNAGAEVEIVVSGVGVLADTSSLVIVIGGLPVSGWSLLYSDVEVSAIMLAAPTALGIGNADIQITVTGTGATSSSSLVVVPTDQNAECVSGCRVGASGSADGSWAAVALGGFPADASANNINAEVDGTLGEVVGFDAERNLWLVDLPAVAFGGAENGGADVSRWLRLQTPAGGGAEALVEVWYVPAPRVEYARFAANGAGIEVRFDTDTNMEGTGACAAVAGVPGDAMGLGSQPVCSWTEPSVLWIALGSGATVLPGTLLAVTAPGVTSADGASDAMPVSEVQVERPRSFLVPELSMVGPAQVAGCDAVAMFTSGASARPMRFEWGCDSNFAVARALASLNASEASFPGDLLVLNEPTEVWVQATTFLGAKSRVLSTVVTRVAVPPPLVSIEVPPPPYLPSSALFFSASCKFSQCAQTETQLRFSWILSPGLEVDPDNIVLAGDKVSFGIPADTLEAGQHYTLTLQTSQGSQLPVTSTVSLNILSSPLVAKMAGGNRLVSRTATVVLDASMSHDPDDAACVSGQVQSEECLSALAFSWRCVTVSAAGQQACRLKGLEKLQLSATAVASLDMSSLALTNADSILVTVTVQGSRGRFATASASFSLAVGDVVDVGITEGAQSAGRVVYSASVHSDIGASASAGNVSYGWRLVGPGLDGAGYTGLALSPWDSNQLILNVGSNLAMQLFQAGAKYMVQLVVRSGGVEGMSKVQLRRPMPPFGGSCWMEVAEAEELVGALVARCENWNAESLPLSYRYGASVAPWAAATAKWSVPTYLSRAELRLSEGDYALAVEVLDDVGTSTVTQSMGAVVTAASSTTEGEREETLAGVLTELDQLGSVSQLMQLSQSIMQGVSSEQSGSGGRRLLASSAAYRLRVRRMLLNQMEGGVAESMSTRTAPAALLTTQQLTAADSPNELQPGMGSSAVVLFERASEELGAGEVSEQLLLDAMQVCNAILFASQMEQTESARDQVIRAALTSMQAVGGQFANKMYVAQQAHDVVLSNVALEVMKVPTANQTLANLDLNTDAGALISMSLKSPIEVGLEKDDGIAVLQIKLTHDVWNHQRIQVISHGVSGVIFMDQSEDEGDARDRRCHDGDCMQLTVDVDLSGRSIAELELFELGLGVTCYRWDHAYWDGQSCKATTLLPAGSNWTQVQLESRVQCNCDQPDGLFVVGFSTSFYLPMEAPWLTTKYYRIVHSGYFRDSFLMGFFGTLTFTVLAVLIPFLYLNRWFPYFGHEEGRSNLYVHANLVEAEQHIFHTVRAKKFPLLCSFKATTPSRLVDPDQIEEDDQPTRPSTAQTATGVEVEMGSTRQDSKGNLFTQRFASAGREMLRSATLTSSGKSSGNGHAEQHSARWDVMQAWGSSKVSSKQHARAQGQKTARQEGLLRAITDRSIGSARIDTTLDIYGAGHRKLVNEDGIFYWETLGVNHAQVLEPFAWSYAHWFAECPVDPALQPVCPSPDMQALDANDTTNAVETLAFAEGSPRARRRSSGTTAYLLAETRGLWSSKARLPPLSVDRLGSYRSLAPPGLLPPASAPDLPDLPAGLPDELEVPPRRPSPPPSPPSNPYMLELEAVRKEREREARERERGAGVLPGLMKSQESMMKMPVEDGGFLGPAGWENSPPRHPAPDPAPPTCTPSAAEPDPAVLLFQAARVRSSESPEAPAVSASLVNATALASPKAHTLLQSAESAEAAGEPPSLPESRPESSMASPTGGNGSQLASAVSVRVDSSTSIDRLESLVDRGRPAYVGDLQRIDSSMSITRLENLAGVGRQDSVRLGSGEWMQKRNSVDCMVSPRDAGSPRPLDSIKNLEQFESLPFERAPSGGRLGGGEWMQRNMSVENLAAVGLTPPRAEVESDLYLEGGQLGRPKRLAGASPRRAGRRGSDFEIALAPRVEEQEEHASSGDEHKTPRMQGVAAEGGRKPETAEGEARNPVGASTPPLGASPVAGARKAPSPRSAPSLEGLEPTVLGLEMGLPGLGPRPLVEDGIGSGDAPTPRIGTADVDDADV